MEIIFLIVGILIGAGIVLVALRPRLRGLVVEADRAAGLDRQLVQASADLEHERALGAERLSAVQRAQERMSESFKVLSNEALQANMTQLVELARGQLQSAQATASGELEKRQQAVEALVAPIREQLGRVDTKLIELDQERRESRGRLDAQLRTLAESGERLRTETGTLVNALSKPNARGQWGQMQLRNVLEAAGMLRHCDFVEQTSYTDDGSTLRPDAVVKMPGGKHLVVDSKAPEWHPSADGPEAERVIRRADYARRLRAHAKALAGKRYWEQQGSPDFVVLFLPLESHLGEAFEADPSLMQDAMAQRVLIATPTTLLALLHSVAYGWQQERLAESAQAVSELGRDLHGRIVKLSTHLSTIGKRLNSAVEAYNSAIGSYEHRVLPSARRFADHGVVAESAELPELERVTVSARRVALAESQLELGGSVATSDEVAARRLRAAE